MRSMWTGSLGFGLVNIPVRLYSATQDQRINFDMLHKTDLSPIRYAKVCRHDGQEVPYDEIVKGVEYGDGHYIVMTDEDFERANVKKSKTIEILSFADLEEVDPLYFEKPYYLEPDKGAEKAYALLREALRKSGKVGVTKFVLRNREHLAIVRPHRNILLLNQMRFAREIRDADGLKAPGKTDVDARETDMAIALINQLAAPFDIEAYKDTYQDELERVIAEKAQGRTPQTKGEAPKAAGEVRDLMSLLKASLEKELEGKPAQNQKKKKAAGKKAS